MSMRYNHFSDFYHFITFITALRMSFDNLNKHSFTLITNFRLCNLANKVFFIQNRKKEDTYPQLIKKMTF